MFTEHRLSNLETWKEESFVFLETVMADSTSKQGSIDSLTQELSQLRATVQVLSTELAALKRGSQ